VTASIFFFITRLAGSGARLTMTALAVGYLMGWSLVPTIVIFSVVSPVDADRVAARGPTSQDRRPVIAIVPSGPLAPRSAGR
jgi:hypothetical protein